MRYKAKVDWWIGMSLFAGLIFPLLSAVGRSSPGPYLVSGLVAAVIFGLLYPQWYETAGDALVIRAGLTTRRIPYNQITALFSSADTGSSLALSLDRVTLEYRGRKLLIAPKDLDAFSADLAVRAPQLSKRGQDLVVSLT